MTAQRRNPLARAGDMELASDAETLPAVALTYDYSQIDAEHRSAVMLSARRIKHKAEQAKLGIVAIGQELAATKDRLEHGQFTAWIEGEFGMSKRVAQLYMNAADVFGGKSETVSLLSDSAMMVLAAPSVPEPAREQAVAEAKALHQRGERLTKKRTQEIIAEYRPARKVYIEPTASEPTELRTLTPEETEAVIWKVMRRKNSGSSPMTNREWLERHQHMVDYTEALLPSVRMDDAVFAEARQKVRREVLKANTLVAGSSRYVPAIAPMPEGVAVMPEHAPAPADDPAGIPLAREIRADAFAAWLRGMADKFDSFYQDWPPEVQERTRALSDWIDELRGMG